MPTGYGWTYRRARFFKGTPMLEVLDFLERLAPFTSPELLLRDEQPLMSA